MASYCSCGEPLSPRANFCPNCAKPTGTIAPIEPDPIPPAVEEVVVEPVDSDVGNIENIRAAVFPAGFAAFVSSIPFMGFLCFIWYPLAGFLAVYSLKRRVGVVPARKLAIKVGAITGVLSFAISLVLSATSMLLVGQDELMEAFQKQAEQFGGSGDIAKLFDSPMLLAVIMIVALAVQCAVAVGFCSLGGALASKILEED